MTNIYSTESCANCKTLKSYLKEQGIEYQEHKVDLDDIAFEQMMNNTGLTSVPQIEYNGQWLVGFSKKKVDALLGIEEDFLSGLEFSDAMQVCESCSA